MLPADVDAAAEIVRRGDWGDRAAFFRFAAGQPQCGAFVAERDGQIVATGIATANGPVGWVGGIFVAADARGAGLGTALTEATIEWLEAAGCRTLVLVASTAGRSLYERIGFRVQAWYHTVEAPGRAGARVVDGVLRPFRPDDLEAITALDAAATGEDRRHLLEAFATPESARCLDSPAGALAGFVVRAPWGGGATVAPRIEDGLAIVEARRAATPPDRRVRAGVLTGNEAALERLVELGWTEAWSAPRLVRGDPLDWHPGHLWGQFNHALG